MTVSAVKLAPVTETLAPVEYRIQSMVDGLDQLASSMERKWGIGRLRLLVSDLLRAKFDEQKDQLDAALQTGEERLVQTQVTGMRRAWEFLDQAARDAGGQPLAPEVWECVLPKTGAIVSIVRSEAEAHQIVRECRVFTLAEIALLIEALGDTVLETKRIFPGAQITAIHRKPPLDWQRGDDIPF